MSSQVVEIAPRLGLLEKLLSERPYGLHDETDGGQGVGEGQAMEMGEGGVEGGAHGTYTFQELLHRVQVQIKDRNGTDLFLCAVITLYNCILPLGD